MDQCEQALSCLKQIQNTRGTNAKRDLLEQYKNNEVLKEILYFAFNPYIKTGIGYTKLYSIEPTNEILRQDIITIFDYLKNNNTGKEVDVRIVRQFIETHKEYEDILAKIFTKSLNIGVSYSTIHKIWPGLIPGFGIQLACKYNDQIDELEGVEVFVTQKLDGNRCFAQVKDHQCTFYSRSGKEIEGMNEVASELSRMADGWYDGEIIAQSFNETQSQTLRKGEKTNLVFNIFDYVTEQEMMTQNCVHNYQERRYHLEYLFRGIDTFQFVKVVPVIARGKCNFDWIMKLLDEASDKGWEGIMLNQNAPYQFWRTGYLTKVKKMYNADLRVIGVQEGRGQNEGKVGALTVDYKGYHVGVGSGLKKEEREYYWTHQDEIIGKIIEVKYQEESKDKQGNLSLRFPVFRGIRTDKNEVSYS